MRIHPRSAIVLASLTGAIGVVQAVAAPAAGARVADDATVTVVNAASHYPEGPLWRGGKLFYVEYSTSRILVWNGRANHVLWQHKGCGASGLAPLPARRLLVTCYDSNQLAIVDARGRTVRLIGSDSWGHGFLGPNDLTRDHKGGVYVSASGVYDVKAPIQGMILHLAADGSLWPVARDIHYSNGLAVTPDGRRLLVSEMLAGRVLSFAVRQDGSLGARRVFARLQDLVAPTPGADAYNGPDGLKVAPDGRVFIAQNGSGRVLIVDRKARLLRVVDVPATYVTNVGFGPTPETLYVTAATDPNNPPYPGVVLKVVLSGR